MAITETYLSMNNYYRYTGGDKIIINHLSYVDSNDMELIQNKLTTVYSGDVISTIPACDCGHIAGRYRLGIDCPECSSPCVDPKGRTAPVLWFESLDDTLPFINPAFWNSVSRLLSRKIDLLRWLSDPDYTPTATVPPYIVLANMEIMGGVRDYRIMVSNLGKLLDYFANSTVLKAKTSYPDLLALRVIYKEHRKSILSTHLPVFNKKLFVIENTTKGKYANLVLGDIIDSITLWLKASKDDVSIQKKSAATGRVLSKLAALYITYYAKFLTSKPGAFRKHIYGARSHFTFRTVISASTGKHRHNVIVPPWVVSVTTYRPHVLNKLIRRGYSYKAADTLLNLSITSYSQVISDILDELVSESPYGLGLPVIAARNPGLLQGSAQFVYIERFNKDPRVLTTELSPLIAKACNADYDGLYSAVSAAA